MSSFTCPKCNTDIIDSPQGYITSCPHYKLENRTRVHCEPTPSILLAMEEAGRTVLPEDLDSELDEDYGPFAHG
jgi:hypothetical protein